MAEKGRGRGRGRVIWLTCNMVGFPKGETFTDKILGNISSKHFWYEDLTQSCLNGRHCAHHTLNMK